MNTDVRPRRLAGYPEGTVRVGVRRRDARAVPQRVDRRVRERASRPARRELGRKSSCPSGAAGAGTLAKNTASKAKTAG